MNEKSDVHILVWRAMPAIQCARWFCHSYFNETKKKKKKKKNQHSVLKYISPMSQRNNVCFLKVVLCLRMHLTNCLKKTNYPVTKASQRILISTVRLQGTKKKKKKNTRDTHKSTLFYRGRVSVWNEMHGTLPVFGMWHAFVYLMKRP